MTTGILIDLTGVGMTRAGVQGWSTKGAAAAVLAGLRDRGRNTDRCIEIHPARSPLHRFWVIGRPDPLAECTWLMDRDGTWARGRLTDDYNGTGARWATMPGPARIPATVTHDYRYSAGSEEVIDAGHSPYALAGGRLIPAGPRLGWFATAWCVACSWHTSDTSEATVRAMARGHRSNPDAYLATLPAGIDR